MAFISFWWDTLVALLILIVGFYLHVRHIYGYWKKKGLECLEPTFFIGNLKGASKKSFFLIFSDIYIKLKSKPYVGYYMALKPGLLVNDLDQIKNILVKDFAHFMDHSNEMNPKQEPLGDHLFNLKGNTWKNLRCKITPTFTSNKMKFMYNSAYSSVKTMMDYLDSNLKCGEPEDLREIMAKLTTDIISSCAFGIESNSFKNPNSEFRKMGKKIFHVPFYKLICKFLFFLFPSLTKVINISIHGKEINDFFYNLVKDIIEYRSKNNLRREDFLQLLIDLNKENSTDDIKSGMYYTYFDFNTKMFSLFSIDYLCLNYSCRFFQ